MTTAQKIRDVFERNHVGLGFAPFSALIDAGYEYEIAHLINSESLSGRDALYDFIDNKLPTDRMDELQICIDTLAFAIGKRVTDLDGTHAVFADGSALSNGADRFYLWTTVDKFTASTDQFFYDHD